MNERMKTFIYCAITAVVTTIVVSVGRPQAAQAAALQVPSRMTITHIIKLGSDSSLLTPDNLRTLIIKKQ